MQTAQPVVAVPAVFVDLHNFQLRCWARAYLTAYETMSLHEAVDALQDLAVGTGLVDVLGQDEVQAIMAEAFELLGGKSW